MNGGAGFGRWKALAAFVVCLILVGLPHAHVFSDPGWAPVLWLATAGVAAASWWTAQPRSVQSGASDFDPETVRKVSPGALIVVAVGGAALTTLFWLRARMGAPSVMFGDLPLDVTLVLGGWAWPAVLLAALHRRGAECVRAHDRKRVALVLLTGFLAGSLGYLAHLPLMGAVEHRPSLALALERPLESPLALSLTGGPRVLEADPAGVVFLPSGPTAGDPRIVTVTGRVLPGIRGGLSRASQGTELRSDDLEVVWATQDDDGRWGLHPVGPGGSVVTVQNRGARTWIGVWVVGDDGVPAPADVTGSIEIETGPTRPPDTGFAEIQRFTLRNGSERPVLGPLHLVFVPVEGSHRPVGWGRTADPVVLDAVGSHVDRGVPWVEVLPGSAFPRSSAPVLGPGESISVELPVTGRLDPDRDGIRLLVFSALRGL